MTEYLKSQWQRMSASTRIGLLCLTALAGIFGCWIVASVQSAEKGVEVLPQDYATFFGLDPKDPQSDPDGDGLTNLEESKLWTDPFSADTDCDGWNDSIDAVPVSRMYVRWGDSRFTKSDDLEYTWPPWALASYRTGGDWSTNDSRSCWHVPDPETNLTSLNIEVDRQILTNNAVCELTFFDHTNATLYVDLYDTNRTVVAEDLFGNLVTGSNVDTAIYLDIPFATYPEAVGICIRRGTGEATVYESLIYVDEDFDGLDAAQEAQLGTSDRVSNGGNAPAVRLPRVLVPRFPGERSASTNAAGNVDNGTNAVVTPVPSVANSVVYVDRQIGSDTLSGRATTVVGNDGPKKTICAGLAEAAANPGSTLVIKSGRYGENLNVAGKNISVVIQGNVDISGHSGNLNVPPPPVPPNPTNVVVGVRTNSVVN
jgi:hypothetical protein